MTLEERLVRLERQNRWIKCGAVVLVGLFLTLGQSKPQDEIKARRFALVDEKGEERGVWWTDEHGPRLVLLENGNPRVILGVDEKGSILALKTAQGPLGIKGNAEVVLHAMKDTCSLRIENISGTIGLASFLLTDPSISITDSNEKALFKAP